MTRPARSVSGMLMVVGLVAATVLWTVPARADIIAPAVTIEVSNADGTATNGLPLVELPPPASDRAKWVLERVPFEVRNGGGQVLATINELSVEFIGDPVVQVNFSATAGGSATTFSLSSALVSFPAMAGPIATATATMTLTDSAADGASVGPVSPDTGMFKAVYNGSTVFAEMIGLQTLSGGGSVTHNAGQGPTTIAGSVNSIQDQIRFVLSATDMASGGIRFEVVPEPAALVLLTVGGLGLLRRRRR